MRTAIVAVIALTLAIITIVGIYASVDSVFSDSEDNVEDTGGFFSGCMGELLREDGETECGLFEESISTGV